MEIISVVKKGDQRGTIAFKHEGKKMILSAKDVESLYEASKDAWDFYIFSEENRNKYPDPSELPKKIPTAKRNRMLYNEYRAGVSKEELAKKFKLKVTTVRNIVRDIKQMDEMYGGCEWN